MEAARSALHFADTAKHVVQAPAVNLVLPPLLQIRRLQADNTALRAELVHPRPCAQRDWPGAACSESRACRGHDLHLAFSPCPSMVADRARLCMHGVSGVPGPARLCSLSWQAVLQDELRKRKDAPLQATVTDLRAQLHSAGELGHSGCPCARYSVPPAM